MATLRAATIKGTPKNTVEYCGIFVLPPIRAWSRLYVVLVLLRQSHAFSVRVRHVLVVALDICVYLS